MIVRASDDARTEPALQGRLQRVARPPSAHAVADEAEPAAVVLGQPVLGHNLHHRADRGVEVVPVRAAPALLVRQVVWDDHRPGALDVLLQVADVFVVFDRRAVDGVIEAIVAEEARVPLVREDRDELTLAVRLGGHRLHLRPILLEHLESVDPLHVSVVGHLRHVVPLRVRRKR